MATFTQIFAIYFKLILVLIQDEWLTCQRNWLYLESIFSAPDIQRQLPSEAKMFMQVSQQDLKYVDSSIASVFCTNIIYL